jgi:hypothetical protein
MSMGQIIVLTAVVGAFVLFAVVLAWRDYRAQQLTRRIRDQDRKEAAIATSAMASKKTDKSTAAASGTQARWPQRSDDRLRHVA